jgi:hypothetical protein
VLRRLERLSGVSKYGELKERDGRYVRKGIEGSEKGEWGKETCG